MQFRADETWERCKNGIFFSVVFYGQGAQFQRSFERREWWLKERRIWRSMDYLAKTRNDTLDRPMMWSINKYRTDQWITSGRS